MWLSFVFSPNHFPDLGSNCALKASTFINTLILSQHEGGINELTFELSKGNSQTFFLQNTKNMQKLIANKTVAKHASLLVDMDHFFIHGYLL
jgi:uncharacterized protein involved in type VI secretion and phage assembly